MTRKTPQKRPAQKQGGRAPSQKKASEGKASFRWLLPVAALSGFIGFIVYLDSIQVDDEMPQPADTITSTPVPEEDSRDDPDFRFYDMLPESTVVPPDVGAYEPGPDATARNIEYILQTGSFRSEADAERQRAQVGFQGLQAHISSISPEPGNTWYRVQVGPYSNRSEMNRAIDRLVAINIQPLVRQRQIENNDD